MKTWTSAIILALTLLWMNTLSFPQRVSALDGKQALQRLLAGNQRYVAKKALHPNQTAERRAEIAKSQHPFAIVLGCSDSRVPPELIFDQGLGDLFVIRVAGNIVDNTVLGSIEYAVEHLHTPLVVVLGHKKCGAVSAAVVGGHAPGHINSLVEAIMPAVERARNRAGDLVENTVRINVDMAVGQLKSSEPILAQLSREGKLMIIGSRYDLDTGAVEIIQ